MYTQDDPYFLQSITENPYTDKRSQKTVTALSGSVYFKKQIDSHSQLQLEDLVNEGRAKYLIRNNENVAETLQKVFDLTETIKCGDVCASFF